MKCLGVYFPQVNLHMVFTELVQSKNTQALINQEINHAYYFKQADITGNK